MNPDVAPQAALRSGPRGRSATAPGFSLVELLVGLAVLSIVTVALMTLVDGAVKVWGQNESRTAAVREARAALLIMARDLANAVSGAAMQFNLESAAATTAYGSNVFFVASLPVAAQEPGAKSDLCQIGYFLAADRSAGGTNQTVNLYRYFRPGSQTSEDLSHGTLFENASTGPGGEEILAHNVAGLRVIAAGTNAAGQWETGYDPAQLPQIVEITITAMSGDPARSSSPEIEAARLKQAARSFTTRVRLVNAR